jgi:hypothetical protein
MGWGWASKMTKNKKEQRKQVHWMIQYLVMVISLFKLLQLTYIIKHTEAPNIIGCYHSNFIS